MARCLMCGVYCLNAARHVYAAEPVAVQAMASRPTGDPRFAEVDASLAVTEVPRRTPCAILLLFRLCAVQNRSGLSALPSIDP